MTFRQKWENYWYHYKWTTFIAVFIVALIIIGIKSFTSKTNPDLYMVYLSNTIIQSDDINNIERAIAEDANLDDIDGDGKSIAYLEHLVSTFEVDGYTDSTYAQKIQTVVFGGQHTLMLVHQYALEDYDGMFENLADFTKDGEKVFKSPTEKFVSGISVEGNEYLESHGINTKDLYIALRRRTTENIAKGKEDKEFKQAHKVMKYILSRQR